jgi:CheY-like chemotaxis protein
LLVDDDPIVRESIAEQLLVSGFKVLAMAAASDALAAIEAGEKLDCLVTDLSMPGMNGLTLINLAQQQRPGLQAILLTGYAAETTALAVGGAMTGAFSLLRKPVLGKELADRIASLLSSPSLAND